MDPEPIPAGAIDPYRVRIGGVIADPYRIALGYDLDAVLGEALKKILRCGRKHKDAETDIEEAIQTLRRWQQIRAEDRHEDFP